MNLIKAINELESLELQITEQKRTGDFINKKLNKKRNKLYPKILKHSRFKKGDKILIKETNSIAFIYDVNLVHFSYVDLYPTDPFMYLLNLPNKKGEMGKCSVGGMFKVHYSPEIESYE